MVICVLSSKRMIYSYDTRHYLEKFFSLLILSVAYLFMLLDLSLNLISKIL